MLKPNDISYAVETDTEFDSESLHQAVDHIGLQLATRAPWLAKWFCENKLTKIEARAKWYGWDDEDAHTFGEFNKLIHRIRLRTGGVEILRNYIPSCGHAACRAELSKPWDEDCPNFFMTAPEEKFDAYVLTHELAHHVENTIRKGRQKQAHAFYKAWAKPAVQAVMGKDRHVSMYGMSEPSEWFAETFSAWVWNPDILSEVARKGMDRALRIATRKEKQRELEMAA